LSTMQNGVRVAELEPGLSAPLGLERLYRQGLTDLTPWHLMTHDHAVKRMSGLRQRYTRKYLPFAYRQDNDDVACLDPAEPDKVFLVHDFADDGSEVSHVFPDFWAWFRRAVEDLIAFDP